MYLRTKDGHFLPFQNFHFPWLLLVGWLVGHILLFFMFFILWPPCSCPDALMTSNAHPHATSFFPPVFRMLLCLFFGLAIQSCSVWTFNYIDVSGKKVNIHAESKSWRDAASTCYTECGELLRVDSKELHNYIYTWAEENGGNLMCNRLSVLKLLSLMMKMYFDQRADLK